MNFLLLVIIIQSIISITTAKFQSHHSKSLSSEFSLEGTWLSKSGTVITGPQFFDPIDELLIEPTLPGISYSFDKYGNWEQSIYKVTSNPQNHSCPSGVLLWQHGTYTTKKNEKAGTTQLKLSPFEDDGRQLLSNPCFDKGISSYMRYNQPETISNYIIEVDGYYGRLKLTLYEWDGTKKQPLWLNYKPPVMLPTKVLNPTSKSHQTGGKGNVKLDVRNKKLKRSIENNSKTRAKRIDIIDNTLIKYICLFSIVIGCLGLIFVLKNLKPKVRLNRMI